MLVDDDFNYVKESFDRAGLWSENAEDLYTQVSPKDDWNIEHLNESISTCLQAITRNCSFLVFALNLHGNNGKIYSTEVSCVAYAAP